MTDIDHFKSVNDTHGHGVGDDVIKYLADVLAENTRPNDLVGRFGGEEFCIVCPNTTIEEGHEIAENIRDIIEKGIGANFLDKCTITASFGVASIHSQASNPSEMVEQSDRALYVSKESGRNRVTNFNDDIEDAATQAANPVPREEATPAKAAPAPVQQDKPEKLAARPTRAVGSLSRTAEPSSWNFSNLDRGTAQNKRHFRFCRQ